jgi:hypothetical protein
MARECAECSAVNTEGAMVCRNCGCPLFLDSGPPSARPRQAAVMVPAASQNLFAWLVGGLASIVLLALAAFMFDLVGSPPQRMQFGPDAPRLAPVLPARVPEPASLPTSTDEAAVAASPASAASAVAALPARSSSSVPSKRPARKAAVNAPAAGSAAPATAESALPAPEQPTPGPAASLAATPETESRPAELCGDRSFLARSVCLARQCNTPALFDHPDCVRIRELDDQRREREELGG